MSCDSAAKTGVSASDGRYMMATLSSSDRAGITAIKSVVSNDKNKNNGLPSVNGAIMLLDSATGELLAIMGAEAAWVMSPWFQAVMSIGLTLLLVYIVGWATVFLGYLVYGHV